MWYICGICNYWVYLKMGIHPSYCNLNGDLVANHQIIGDAVFRPWVVHLELFGMRLENLSQIDQSQPQPIPVSP